LVAVFTTFVLSTAGLAQAPPQQAMVKQLHDAIADAPSLDGGVGTHTLATGATPVVRTFVLEEGHNFLNTVDEIHLSGWALYPTKSDLEKAAAVLNGGGIAEDVLPEVPAVVVVFGNKKPNDVPGPSGLRIVNVFERGEEGLSPLGDVILRPTALGSYRVEIVTVAERGSNDHAAQAAKIIASFRSMHRAVQLASRMQVTAKSKPATTKATTGGTVPLSDTSLFLYERAMIEAVYKATVACEAAAKCK